MTKDNDMPQEIWLGRNVLYDNFEIVEEGASCDKYTRHDPDSITISRKELEGMKMEVHLHQGEYASGYNQLIDELLDR